MSYKSEFLQRLEARGFIHQCSDADALDSAAKAGGLIGYIGFDCTAKSLHVGNLVSLMLLRHLQQAGGKPIILLGGGTTKIGDPSGKEAGRPLLSADEIAANQSAIKQVFARFIDLDSALMLDNDDWLCGLNYLDFLRDYGRHFSVNRMLGYDSVRLRLEREQPLSFIEFNYMVLQAYDFVELHRRHKCRLQMGGSDQWGNIINGIDLARRVDGAELFGLTTPLLTTAGGAKMGKTAQGAVWLNADMLSAYDYWQFWRNSDDGDVGRFLRLFTELPLDEIARLEQAKGAELNAAKKILATEATALAHGATAAEAAAATARETFEASGRADGLPEYRIAASDLADGLGVLHAFKIAELVASLSEARRLIEGGGARINDAPIGDVKAQISSDDLIDGAIKLSLGKKRHALLRAE